MPTNALDKKPLFPITYTDNQLFALAYAEWSNVLQGMWRAIGKEVDPVQLKEYERVFKTLPRELLQLVVDHAVRNNGVYKTIPTIGALTESLRKVLGNPIDVDEAVMLWEQARWSGIVMMYGEVSDGIYPVR